MEQVKCPISESVCKRRLCVFLGAQTAPLCDMAAHLIAVDLVILRESGGIFDEESKKEFKGRFEAIITGFAFDEDELRLFGDRISQIVGIDKKLDLFSDIL